MAFAYSVILSDPNNLAASADSLLVADLDAALSDWSKYIAGIGTLVVQLNVLSTSTGRADGGSTSAVSTHTTLNGKQLLELSSVYELTTGQHAPGAASDITINVDPAFLSTLFLNPNPGDNAISPTKVDAVAVFRHELAHGFGMQGYYAGDGSLLDNGTFETAFDAYIQIGPDGLASFTGPAAEAVYGGPVPLTTDTTTENYYHFANSISDPLGQDLMNGQAFNRGTLYPISDMDLAVLQDIGVPFAGANPPSTDVLYKDSGFGVTALHGSHDGYVVGDNNGSLYLQDTVAGRDGTQILATNNVMTFTDGTGLFDPTGTAEDVDRVYSAALGRAPDVSGLEFWSNAVNGSHVPLTSVADSFAASPEFIQNYGSLSDPAFVQQLYQNVLNRPGDTGGTQFWQSMLASGATRGAVLLGLAQSPESRARTLPTAGDENNAEAYRLYQAGLNRAPDQAGETFWAAAIEGGATPTQVAQGFINSVEFQKNFGSLSAGDFVAQLYENVLHRAGDSAGQQFWSTALQQGTSEASALVGFSDGIENRAQTAGATHANWVFIHA
jgi:Domain of unknown function (DUF4214)